MLCSMYPFMYIVMYNYKRTDVIPKNNPLFSFLKPTIPDNILSQGLHNSECMSETFFNN